MRTITKKKILFFQIQQASLMKRNGRFLRQNPSAAYKIHCILYVVKATSNFMIDESQSLTLMRQIRRSKKEEGKLIRNCIQHIAQINSVAWSD